MIYIKAGERCVIRNTALMDNINVNATVIIEEIGRGTPAQVRSAPHSSRKLIPSIQIGLPFFGLTSTS
jgi:hypothetical protein